MTLWRRNSLSELDPTAENVNAFDALLDASSDRIEVKTAALREQNRHLESLIAETTARVEALEGRIPDEVTRLSQSGE
jgi:hypothetical protein